MNKIFTFFFLFLSLSFSAHCQQNISESQQIQPSNTNADNLIFAQSLNLVQSDSSQIKKIVALNNTNSNDTNALFTIWNNDTTLSKITFNDFIAIMQVLHKYQDTTYTNNKESFDICKKLISNYLIEKKEILQGFKTLTDKENNKYYEQNILNFLAINFFQLFYIQGSQYVLLETKIQEALKPKIIDNMIFKTNNDTKLQNELIFIAKHSNQKLFNF